MRLEERTRYRIHGVGLTVVLLFVGCVHEDSLNGHARQFDPETFLQQELKFAPGTSPDDLIILPEDLESRPDLKKLVTQYMTIKQADTNLAALTFINEKLELGDNMITARDRADLHLVRATTQFAMADFPEATKSCDQAIDFDSTNWRAFHFRAMLREKKGDDQGFHDDMRRVVKLRGGKPTRPLSTTGYVI